MVSELKILNLAFRPLSDEDDGTLNVDSGEDPEGDGDDEPEEGEKGGEGGDLDLADE